MWYESIWLVPHGTPLPVRDDNWLLLEIATGHRIVQPISAGVITGPEQHI